MKKVVTFLCIVSLVACTPPGRTTGTGAAVGAALGAGVGGIVGSQTGDPGAGFLIGGAAGAGAGASVGNLVQMQDEQLASRDEEIARQQKLISTQEREIAALRSASRDQVVFNTGTQSTNASSFSPNFNKPQTFAAGSGMSAVPSTTAPLAITEENVSGFAPRFDNKPIPVGGDTVVSQSEFPKPISPSQPVLPEAAPPALALNNSMNSMPSANTISNSEPRYSARLEPISRGYYGGTKTSSAVSTGVKVTESTIPLSQKKMEEEKALAMQSAASKAAITPPTVVAPAVAAASVSKTEAVVANNLEVKPEVAATQKTETPLYTSDYQPGTFALSESDTVSSSSAATKNALSFSKLEDMKAKSAPVNTAATAPEVVTEVGDQSVAAKAVIAPDEAVKVISAPDVEKTSDVVQVPQRLASSELASQECVDASSEVKSANMASELADKLFHYRRALRLCPTNSEFHSGLAKVYLALDRRDDAKFELEEALRINPTNADAKAQLEKLK